MGPVTLDSLGNGSDNASQASGSDANEKRFLALSPAGWQQVHAWS